MIKRCGEMKYPFKLCRRAAVIAFSIIFVLALIATSFYVAASNASLSYSLWLTK